MTTAVTIAPSKLSNVMALPSQAGAGVQIERGDGKGRHAYGNKDKVEKDREALDSPFGASLAAE
jgi:hypothetical protein